MTRPSSLYHFTCGHGHEGICASGRRIIPQIRHPLLGVALSWFTTEAIPDLEATGLTSNMLSCDRTEHRYVITDLRGCVPWLTSIWRMTTPKANLAALESGGHDIEHWWVSNRPVPAEYDPEWAGLIR